MWVIIPWVCKVFKKNKGSAMTLRKQDIVNRIASELGLHNRKAGNLTEMLLERIKGTLENGEDLLISNFGKFCVNEKAERKGRNPATNTHMMLRKRRTVTFKYSGRLKDRVNR